MKTVRILASVLSGFLFGGTYDYRIGKAFSAEPVPSARVFVLGGDHAR